VYAEQALALYEQALKAPGSPAEKVKRLLKLPAGRLADADFYLSCPAGTVSLDLDSDLEGLRGAVQSFFDRMVELIAERLGMPDPHRARSFAGLLMTTIEGAYIRGRAERSTRAFDEAADWLSEIADARTRL
jgi:hypothetical protein